MNLQSAFGIPGEMVRCSNIKSLLPIVNMLNPYPKRKQNVVMYETNSVMLQDLQHNKLSNMRKLPRCLKCDHYFLIVVDPNDENKSLLLAKALSKENQRDFIYVFKHTENENGYAWIGENMLFVRGTNVHDFFYVCDLEYARKAQVTFYPSTGNQTTFCNSNIKQYLALLAQ